MRRSIWTLLLCAGFAHADQYRPRDFKFRAPVEGNPFDVDLALNRNLDFRVDQQHSDWAQMVAFDRVFRRRPVVTVEFSYELGVEALPTHTNRNQVGWEEMLRRAYWIYLAGGYAAYYYNNTAWDIVKPDPEAPGMARWQTLKQVFESVPYWRMAPANHLAVGGPCLAEAGRTYLCYAEGPNLTLNLGAETAGEWVNTWTGEREPAGRIPAGVARVTKPKRFDKAPALLVVRGDAKP